MNVNWNRELEADEASLESGDKTATFWAGFERRPQSGAQAGRGQACAGKLPLILAPTDFGPAAGTTLRRTFQFAAARASRVLLLHVFDLNLAPLGPANVSQIKQDLFHESLAKAEPHLRLAHTMGLKAHCLVQEGNAAKAIINAASVHGASLVVMGTSQRSALARFFSRGIVNAVLRSAPCPILVLPPNRGSFL